MKRQSWGLIWISVFAAQPAFAQQVGVGASASGSTAAAPSGSAAATATSPAIDEPVVEPAPAQPVLEETTMVTPAYAGARADESRSMSTSARFAQLPYMQRYKPTWNLWEVGLFGGLFIPSRSHNLQQPGSPTENYQSVSPSLGARLAYFPASFLGLEVEGMVSSSDTAVTDTTTIIYGARAHGILQLPLWSVVPFAAVGGGFLGASSAVMGHDADPAFHFGGGLKIPFNHLVSARLDVRDNVAQKRNEPNGTATHNLEVLLGATFTFERTPPAAPVDADYDGLYDHEDKCPQQGALTVDGCPVDTDGDTLFDAEDRCPSVAAQTADGCPLAANPDTDKDGIPVPCDICPDVKGVAPDGCAIKDTDGDGFMDDVDKCPKEPETRNGFEDNDGCPDQMPEAMKRFTGIMRGIAFDQGKATIRKESYATLDAAHEVLAKYPSIKIEISGHTSSEGPAEVNQKLSEDRAAAVRDYLVQKGIAGDRIISRGAGPAEPVADNATRAGREQNRRIEFKIVADP